MVRSEERRERFLYFTALDALQKIAVCNTAILQKRDVEVRTIALDREIDLLDIDGDLRQGRTSMIEYHIKEPKGFVRFHSPALGEILEMEINAATEFIYATVWSEF